MSFVCDPWASRWLTLEYHRIKLCFSLSSVALAAVSAYEAWIDVYTPHRTSPRGGCVGLFVGVAQRRAPG